MINTINNKVFRNANEAYEYIHDRILQDGVAFGDTKALFNVGFYITDPKGYVNSNYGYQWDRNAQLDMVIEMLKHKKDTRQACVSIYDGKEISDYALIHHVPMQYNLQL